MGRRQSDIFLKAIVAFGLLLIIAGFYFWFVKHLNADGLFCFGCGLILFYMFGVVANRVLIHTNAIVLSAFLLKRQINYNDIDYMEYKMTGKLFSKNYTGLIYLKNGGRRKLLAKDEESMEYLKDTIQRAQAMGYSEREGETIYLR